jgi:hypothetical protein
MGLPFEARVWGAFLTSKNSKKGTGAIGFLVNFPCTAFSEVHLTTFNTKITHLGDTPSPRGVPPFA